MEAGLGIVEEAIAQLPAPAAKGMAPEPQTGQKVPGNCTGNGPLRETVKKNTSAMLPNLLCSMCSGILTCY